MCDYQVNLCIRSIAICKKWSSFGYYMGREYHSKCDSFVSNSIRVVIKEKYQYQSLSSNINKYGYMHELKHMSFYLMKYTSQINITNIFRNIHIFSCNSLFHLIRNTETTFLIIHEFLNDWSSYSISQEICPRFCCALLRCGYAIVHNEFTWSIYSYSSGLLCWHWSNR